MDSGQVLKEVPELTRDLLYSWEAQGYISPNKESIGKAGYRRRDYAPRDVVKIKKMFEYYNKQGMSPRKASEKAEQDIAKGPNLFETSLTSKKTGEE